LLRTDICIIDKININDILLRELILLLFEHFNKESNISNLFVDETCTYIYVLQYINVFNYGDIIIRKLKLVCLI